MCRHHVGCRSGVDCRHPEYGIFSLMPWLAFPEPVASIRLQPCGGNCVRTASGIFSCSRGEVRSAGGLSQALVAGSCASAAAGRPHQARATP